MLRQQGFKTLKLWGVALLLLPDHAGDVLIVIDQ